MSNLQCIGFDQIIVFSSNNLSSRIFERQVQARYSEYSDTTHSYHIMCIESHADSIWKKKNIYLYIKLLFYFQLVTT